MNSFCSTEVDVEWLGRYIRYKAYFKEGHDDGWENHAVVFADKRIAIVLMSNSSNGDRKFKELLERLTGDQYTPWKWEGYIP